jgi:lysophospholipase L1-like esterase
MFKIFKNGGSKGGAGTVTKVANVAPDGTGNVPLTKEAFGITNDFDNARKTKLDSLSPGVNSADVSAIKSILPIDLSIYPNPTRAVGYYSSANGTFVAGVSPYSGYLMDRFAYGEKIYISAHIKDPGTALAVYLDASNVFLGNQFVGTNSDVAYTDQLLTIPAGTAKIGITEYNNTPSLVIKSGQLSSDILTKKTADVSYSPYTSLQKQVKLPLTGASKIVLFATSIESQDYPWFAESMAQLTGASVQAMGIPGFVASQAANSLQDRVFDQNPNLIVLQLTANEPGEVGSVGTFGAFPGEPIVAESDITVAYAGNKLIQAIDYTIRKIKAQYYDIRTRAGVVQGDTEAQKTAKMDAVLKPYLVVLTGFPQKRIDANNIFTNQANQLRKRNAVLECCAKNNVHCIDTFKLLEWDMSMEPYWPGTTDKLTNYGIYTMDGLHLNKYGYQQLSRIICGQIGII